MGRVKTILFWLAAILLPIGLVLSHRNVPVVLVLIALAGLPALRQLKPHRWMLAVWGLMFWAILTTLWSGYGDAMAWPGYLLVLGGLGTAALLAGAGAEGRIIALGALVGLALLTIESVSGGIIRDVVPPDARPDKDDVATARGITILLCMVPGLMLFLRARIAAWKPALGAAAAAALLCAMSFGVTANILGYMAALAAAVLVFLSPRWGIRLAVAAAIVPFFLMPMLAFGLPSIEDLSALETGPASWRMRIVAWKAVAQGLADGWPQLVFGHGVEGARVYGEALGPMVIPGSPGTHDMIPTHPHNVYLQVWFDLGLVGAALAVTACLMAGRALLKADLPRPVLAAVAGLIAMTTVFALIDASLWTLWRVAGPLLGAWLILVVSREARQGGAA